MQTPSELRQRSFIVPREHGAWGILLVPLLTGAFVGLRAGGSAAGSRLSAFSPSHCSGCEPPSRAGPGRRPFARERLANSALFGMLLRFSRAGVRRVRLAVLGMAESGLLWIGAAAAMHFFFSPRLKRVWRGARTAAQMIGAAGLTSTAPGAFYVVTGRLDAAAWTLWAANLVFAMNQIQFVQLRIHAARVASRGESCPPAAGSWPVRSWSSRGCRFIGDCSPGTLPLLSCPY